MARSLPPTAEVKNAQLSFGGGELAPGIHHRVDLAKFQIGLRKTKNVYIELTGGASNRAGTWLATEVKDSTKRVRIEPFESTDDNTFLLEMGEFYIRVLYRGAYALDGIGSIIEVSTPYTEDEVFELDFDQVNDVMTLTHPSHDPRELRRVSNTSWTISAPAFVPTLLPPTGLTVTDNFGGSVGDRVQQYKVAAVNDAGEESLPSSILVVQNSFENANDRVAFSWTIVAGAKRYNIYKYFGGIFAYMGTTTDLSVIDNNIVPIPGDTPRTDVQYFTGANNKPATTWFYNQRRGFAATNLNPQSVFLTEVGLFNSFKRSIPGKPTDGVTFALAAKRAQTILYAIPLEDLLLFTPTTEWRIAAAGGFSATDLPDARPQSFYGCAKVKPLVVGSDVMYIQKLGQTIFRMNYSNDFNRYVSEEMNVLARHLFRRKNQAVSWSYAKAPFNLLWVIRSDGKFMTMTYSREQDVYAWAQHDTQGKMEWTASVDEDGTDVAYFVARRKINGVYKRFIEYMDKRDLTDPRDAHFMDCGVSINLPINIEEINTGAFGTVITSTAHGLIDGDSVYIDPSEGAEAISGRYKVGSVLANSFRIFDYGDGTTPVTTATVGVIDYTEGGVYRKMVDVITGLDHLEGERIVALVDGLVAGVEEELVVAGGSVTLPIEGGVVHLGLSYSSYIETLELDKSGEARQGTMKTAPSVVIDVEDTRGIYVQVGKTPKVEVKPRNYEPYYDPPALLTGQITQNLPPTWETVHRIQMGQDYPLPMTILSAIPNMQYGR